MVAPWEAGMPLKLWRFMPPAKPLPMLAEGERERGRKTGGWPPPPSAELWFWADSRGAANVHKLARLKVLAANLIA